MNCLFGNELHLLDAHLASSINKLEVSENIGEFVKLDDYGFNIIPMRVQCQE